MAPRSREAQPTARLCLCVPALPAQLGGLPSSSFLTSPANKNKFERSENKGKKNHKREEPLEWALSTPSLPADAAGEN